MFYSIGYRTYEQNLFSLETMTLFNELRLETISTLHPDAVNPLHPLHDHYIAQSQLKQIIQYYTPWTQTNVNHALKVLLYSSISCALVIYSSCHAVAIGIKTGLLGISSDLGDKFDNITKSMKSNGINLLNLPANIENCNDIVLSYIVDTFNFLHQYDGENCVICFDDLYTSNSVFGDETDRVRSSTSRDCSGKHLFHAKCIDEWLVISGKNIL
jgi:hypothetical protein